MTPGASISLETNLDPYLTKADSLAGNVAGLEDKLPELSYKLKIKVELFKEVLGTVANEKVEPLKTREMLMLSTNTTITVGTIEKISGNEIIFNLNFPVVVSKGDNVGIARNIKGHWRLIGWGKQKLHKK